MIVLIPVSVPVLVSYSYCNESCTTHNHDSHDPYRQHPSRQGTRMAKAYNNGAGRFGQHGQASPRSWPCHNRSVNIIIIVGACTSKVPTCLVAARVPHSTSVSCLR